MQRNVAYSTGFTSLGRGMADAGRRRGVVSASLSGTGDCAGAAAFTGRVYAMCDGCERVFRTATVSLRRIRCLTRLTAGAGGGTFVASIIAGAGYGRGAERGGCAMKPATAHAAPTRPAPAHNTARTRERRGRRRSCTAGQILRVPSITGGAASRKRCSNCSSVTVRSPAKKVPRAGGGTRRAGATTPSPPARSRFARLRHMSARPSSTAPPPDAAFPAND